MRGGAEPQRVSPGVPGPKAGPAGPRGARFSAARRVLSAGRSRPGGKGRSDSERLRGDAASKLMNACLAGAAHRGAGPDPALGLHNQHLFSVADGDVRPPECWPETSPLDSLTVLEFTPQVQSESRGSKVCVLAASRPYGMSRREPSLPIPASGGGRSPAGTATRRSDACFCDHTVSSCKDPC